MTKPKEIPQELLDRLTYDPSTGYLHWLGYISPTACHGKRAGSMKIQSPYREIRYKGKVYLEHRVAWRKAKGELSVDIEIDHINLIKDDNRLVNLRIADHGQNGANGSLRRSNTTGLKGAYWDKRRSKWYATICVKGRQKRLGDFPTALAAHQAYMNAAAEAFGEFARAA